MVDADDGDKTHQYVDYVESLIISIQGIFSLALCPCVAHSVAISAATQHPQPTHYGLCQRLLNRIEFNGCCNAAGAVGLCGKCSNLGALNLPQLPVLPLRPHC